MIADAIEPNALEITYTFTNRMDDPKKAVEAFKKFYKEASDTVMREQMLRSMVADPDKGEFNVLTAKHVSIQVRAVTIVEADAAAVHTQPEMPQ